MKVKVCGITKAEQIRKLEKLEIEYLGFINIKRSKRFVEMDKITSFENQLSSKRMGTLVLEPSNPYDVILKSNRLEYSTYSYIVSPHFTSNIFIGLTDTIILKE